jgi:hypothetical protein
MFVTYLHFLMQSAQRLRFTLQISCSSNIQVLRFLKSSPGTQKKTAMPNNAADKGKGGAYAFLPSLLRDFPPELALDLRKNSEARDV